MLHRARQVRFGLHDFYPKKPQKLEYPHKRRARSIYTSTGHLITQWIDSNKIDPISYKKQSLPHSDPVSQVSIGKGISLLLKSSLISAEKKKKNQSALNLPTVPNECTSQNGGYKLTSFHGNPKLPNFHTTHHADPYHSNPTADCGRCSHRARGGYQTLRHTSHAPS